MRSVTSILSICETAALIFQTQCSPLNLIINFNPLPDMPVLGSSNSAAIIVWMQKVWTNGDKII